MNCFAYLRVSTAEQRLGIASQEEAIFRYADYKELPPPTVFSDVGVSGGLPLAQRPRGSAMVRALRPGDHVVIHKLDRAWRNTLDCLTHVNEWAAMKITLHVVDIGLDLSTPHGKFFLTVLAGIAEMERNMISTRTKEGMAQSDKRIGQEPFGERPEEGATIKMALGLREKGYSWKEVAKGLDLANRPTRSGKPWCERVIQRICARHTAVV